MNPPKTAVIRTAFPREGTYFLFRHNIAGLSVFKRLILSLQRAGIENFIILAQNISATDKHWLDLDIQKDFRFKKKLQWNNLGRERFEDEWNRVRSALGNDNVLFVEIDLVTTTGLIKDFIAAAFFSLFIRRIYCDILVTA